jgi:hypothetical protein
VRRFLGDVKKRRTDMVRGERAGLGEGRGGDAATIEMRRGRCSPMGSRCVRWSGGCANTCGRGRKRGQRRGSGRTSASDEDEDDVNDGREAVLEGVWRGGRSDGGGRGRRSRSRGERPERTGRRGRRQAGAVAGRACLDARPTWPPFSSFRPVSPAPPSSHSPHQFYQTIVLSSTRSGTHLTGNAIALIGPNRSARDPPSAPTHYYQRWQRKTLRSDCIASSSARPRHNQPIGQTCKRPTLHATTARTLTPSPSTDPWSRVNRSSISGFDSASSQRHRPGSCIHARSHLTRPPRLALRTCVNQAPYCFSPHMPRI